MKHKNRRADKRIKEIDAKRRAIDNKLKTLMEEARRLVLNGPKDFYAQTVQKAKDIEAEVTALEAASEKDEAAIAAKKKELAEVKGSARLMADVLLEDLKKMR